MNTKTPSDLGFLDSYYGRNRRSTLTTPEDLAEYDRAFDQNERERNFKDWGHDED